MSKPKINPKPQIGDLWVNYLGYNFIIIDISYDEEYNSDVVQFLNIGNGGHTFKVPVMSVRQMTDVYKKLA